MTITHNLSLDLEDLFQDDLLLLDTSPSGFDETWSNDQIFEEISNVSSSPTSSQDICTKVTSRSRWNDDRLEWIELVEPNADGRFKCPKCTRLYTRRSNLKVHFASFHIGIKRFVCPGCSKQFARRSYVRQHQSKCNKNLS